MKAVTTSLQVETGMRNETIKFRRRLLAWYGQHQRDLPWRANRDPYRVWLSEIMLQQTRVAAVIEHYNEFLRRFPAVEKLARAREASVLAAWSGLGYYRRARMMHAAAKVIVREHGGKFPVTEEGLRKLPGIGRYTAAAIASIAFGEPVAVVDGNVERVLCRIEGWKAGSRSGGGAQVRRKAELLAAELLSPERPGDFNQAMMELGATLCVPRNPQCLICPVAEDCKTQGEHDTAPRPPMQCREVAHALSVRSGRRAGQLHREVLLEQRPPTQTVMPGLWELPQLIDAAVPDEELRLSVRHAIMQVNYYVRIRTVFEDDIDAMTMAGGERRWVPLGEAAGMALTGLARKVLSRLHLLTAPPLDAIVPQAGVDLL